METLVQVCEDKGRFKGPVFATADGQLAASPDYDAIFRKYLKWYRRRPTS
jgi:hypothetical protein